MAAQVPATALEETTLDEPVSETLNRELRAIANKMHKVVVYSSDSKAELRNWDLWGPLVLCLVLAITLSTGATHAPVVDSKGHEIQAPTDDDSGGVFAAVFVIVWCGAAVVTLNAVLLGGTVSFFQSICVLGYCVFPLTCAALVCMGVGWSGCSSSVCLVVRFATTGLGLVWSTKASMGFLDEVVSSKRSALAGRNVVLHALHAYRTCSLRPLRPCPCSDQLFSVFILFCMKPVMLSLRALTRGLDLTAYPVYLFYVAIAWIILIRSSP